MQSIIAWLFIWESLTKSKIKFWFESELKIYPEFNPLYIFLCGLIIKCAPIHTTQQNVLQWHHMNVKIFQITSNLTSVEKAVEPKTKNHLH